MFRYWVSVDADGGKVSVWTGEPVLRPRKKKGLRWETVPGVRRLAGLHKTEFQLLFGLNAPSPGECVPISVTVERGHGDQA